MKITQKDRVLDYLKRFKSITTFDAFKDLGNTRLSSSIFLLRKDGYNIISEPIKVKTRYGNYTTVTKYTLKRKRKAV